MPIRSVKRAHDSIPNLSTAVKVPNLVLQRLGEYPEYDLVFDRAILVRDLQFSGGRWTHSSCSLEYKKPGSGIPSSTRILDRASTI